MICHENRKLKEKLRETDEEKLELNRKLGAVNEDIKKKEDKAKVRAEILKKLLEEMVKEEIFMGIHSVRRIVEKLGHLYPAMFFESKSDTGYGLGGGQGNVQLPRHLMDRYHKKLNLMGR